MDSYEKLRRMSEISKQLKKHGLVSDSNEAIKQAEEMVASGNSSDNDVYVSQERYRSAMDADSLKNKEANSMDKSTEIINALKNLNQVLNDKVSAINSDVNMMKSKMNEIIGKINELEAKIGNASKHEFQATLRRDEPKEQRADPPRETKEDRKVKAEAKEEYKPQDVAMDKVFYFGKR